MPLPVIYHEDYSPDFPENHRFPMAKFRLLQLLLVQEKTVAAEAFIAPDLAPMAALLRAHDAGYVTRFMSNSMHADESRRMGLPWSQGLVQRSLREVGGTLLAARLALSHGLAVNLAGGTHHAHRDRASGFCIFNDLAITALALQAQGRRVLIIDCDVHQGDGSARLLADVPDVFTFSMHAAKNFPARKAVSHWDLPLPNGTDDSAYLAQLVPVVTLLLRHWQPDVVLYDAGVDVHGDDALGYLSLTDAGLYARDYAVLSACLNAAVPVAAVLGGGYAETPQQVAERHAMLPRAAQALWQAFMAPDEKAG